MITTGFEDKSTGALEFVRANIVRGVTQLGEDLVTGKAVRGEAQVMVPIQVALLEFIDAELLKRGVEVAAPPWEED